MLQANLLKSLFCEPWHCDIDWNVLKNVISRHRLTFGIGVFVKLLLEGIYGERAKLLESDHRRVLTRLGQRLSLLQ